MAFWDNLTLAEKMLGCDFRFRERFFPEKVVISILQIQRQFWVAERRGKCWPFFPHSCWDHLTLADFFFLGGGETLPWMFSHSILQIERQVWVTTEWGNAGLFSMSFRDNLTLAENLLGCDFDWENFHGEFGRFDFTDWTSILGD